MLILNFHRIESPTGLEITRITPARFRRLLQMLEQSGVTVAKPGSDPLSAGNEVLLTFDDGFASVARHALPELKRRGWGAVVFLIAASIGTTDDWDVRLLGRRRMMMNWDDIYEWSPAGIEFGSHTMTHADLTALSTDALTSELVDSKSVLEQKLGRSVRLLSYPYGRHNARVRKAVAAAGYQAAFSTDAQLWNQDDPWAIPRVGINGLTSLFEFESMLQAVSHDNRGEGKGWRRRWHGRIFESLNAGSAAVGNWRRARRSKTCAARSADSNASTAHTANNREFSGQAGLRY